MRTADCRSLAAACLLGVAGNFVICATPARAHDGAHGARDARADAANAVTAPAAPRVSRNRWGADYFPNVPLVTQDGATVRFYDDLLKDKAVAINVIYTSCKDECPLETARLVQLQQILGERVGKEIFFYSISIDPENDTPKVLKDYAEKYGVGPGWLFLTGKPEDIKAVVKKIGLSRGSDRQNRDGHTASLMIGNVAGGLWMRNSAVDNPQFLAVTIGNFLGWRDPKQGRSYAEARPLVLDPGQYLFQSRCSTCHSVGQGDKLGPDLLGVTARRDRAWLARYLSEPGKMLAEGDPAAAALAEKYKTVRMPNQNLGGGDLSVVLEYLEARNKAPREPAQKDSVTSAR